ncbi:MAG: ribosomal L7Ae/L30e/S12e/Gadd45 family protein [Candidatus Cloacimonetes bacterium]|nr:ribosomal L7Ae/L30e/S12e/Gadd45 family protein [Candidatus Cloacimonadota bacterium]
MEKKVYNLLHLARRAGKVIFGFDAVKRLCHQGKCRLLLCSSDLAEKTIKNLRELADAYNVKMIIFGSMADFGREFKIKDTGIIAVSDADFAGGITRILG